MKPYKITQQIHFCYGHRLLDYDGKCANLHGHNATAEFVFEADQLDSRGMILDFVDIKEKMKAWIDKTIDHKMLLRKDDPTLKALEELGESVYVLENNPTVEVISKLLFDQAKRMNLPITEVKVWETPNQYAVYRPNSSS